jgi:hypothetical protein
MWTYYSDNFTFKKSCLIYRREVKTEKNPFIFNNTISMDVMVPWKLHVFLKTRIWKEVSKVKLPVIHDLNNGKILQPQFCA